MKDELFLKAIDHRVLNVLMSTDDFPTVLSRNPGIHPIMLVQSYERLLLADLISKRKYASLMHNAEIPRNTDILYPEECLYPVPHFLDSDWRFSKRTQESLVRVVRNHIQDRKVKSVAFIGAPSLFKIFSRLPNSNNADFYLVDCNASLHNQGESLPENFHTVDCRVNYSFCIEELEVKADIVVMDPPWYFEYIKRFFEICSYSCNIGGIVLCAFPPAFTRASIDEEFQELRDYCGSLGFSELKKVRSFVTYMTPPFEVNTIKANGINNFPLRWRTGDVVISRFLTEKVQSIPIDYSFLTATSGWAERTLGDVRLKIKNQVASFSSFYLEIHHLFPHDVIPEISRSPKTTEPINLWTSGNRVYHCTNITVLYIILDNFNDPLIIDSIQSEYSTILSQQERESILACHQLITELINIESQENMLWGFRTVE